MPGAPDGPLAVQEHKSAKPAKASNPLILRRRTLSRSGSRPTRRYQPFENKQSLPQNGLAVRAGRQVPMPSTAAGEAALARGPYDATMPATMETEKMSHKRVPDRKSTRLNSSHLVISYAV